MSRSISAQDRSSLIKLASSLPAGSSERKVILAGLVRADSTKVPADVLLALVQHSGEDLRAARRRFDLLEEDFERVGLVSVRAALSKLRQMSGPDRTTVLEYFEARSGLTNSRDKAAMNSATVSAFLTVAGSKLSQYDQKLQLKQPNPYRLGHYLEALDRVRQDVSSLNGDSSPEALAQLKRSFAKHFANLAPINATIKQIDQYLATGKMPSPVR